MYVGDDVGIVHQFKSFFGGPPTVGWTSTTVGSTSKLTGPVVDPNSPGLIYFGDSSGYLHSLTSSGGTAVTADQNDCGTAGFTDAPLIDSAYTTSYVYVFVSYGCDSGNHSYINAYNAGATISGTYGPYDVEIGTGSSGQKVYVGAFDNRHSTSNNGNLYVCMGDTSTGNEPTLYQVALGSGGGGNPSLTLHTYNSTSNGAATCSPVTEFDDGTHDWVFLSVSASGNQTTYCTGACLYNYSIPTSGTTTTGSPTAGMNVAGGASGTIIDNNSTTPTDASNIYFYSLSQGTPCASGNGCAVQASQSSP
jgi:hypothetical protein